MAWIKLYETYNKVKEVFAKPKLNFKFGLWKNDNCLPVWRQGPTIQLFSNKFIYQNSYQARCYVNITTHRKGDKLPNGEIATCNHGTYNSHKLPGNLQDWDRVWNRNFRKKLKKFGLGWLKPTYKLPLWCSFHIFNHDLMWKTKWSSYDIRYEFPPQFTIVLFGLSFSWWLTFPTYDYFYWECILHYLYGRKSRDLMNTIKSCGKWTTYYKDMKYNYFAFEKLFLKPKYWKEYDDCIKEIEYQEYINKDNEDET